MKRVHIRTGPEKRDIHKLLNRISSSLAPSATGERRRCCGPWTWQCRAYLPTHACDRFTGHVPYILSSTGGTFSSLGNTLIALCEGYFTTVPKTTLQSSVLFIESKTSTKPDPAIASFLHASIEGRTRHGNMHSVCKAQRFSNPVPDEPRETSRCLSRALLGHPPARKSIQMPALQHVDKQGKWHDFCEPPGTIGKVVLQTKLR